MPDATRRNANPETRRGRNMPRDPKELQAEIRLLAEQMVAKGLLKPAGCPTGT